MSTLQHQNTFAPGTPHHIKHFHARISHSGSTSSTLHQQSFCIGITRYASGLLLCIINRHSAPDTPHYIKHSTSTCILYCPLLSATSSALQHQALYNIKHSTTSSTLQHQALYNIKHSTTSSTLQHQAFCIVPVLGQPSPKSVISLHSCHRNYQLTIRTGGSKAH